MNEANKSKGKLDLDFFFFIIKIDCKFCVILAPITDQPRFTADTTRDGVDGAQNQPDESLCLDCCVCCTESGVQCCDNVLSWL